MVDFHVFLYIDFFFSCFMSSIMLVIRFGLLDEQKGQLLLISINKINDDDNYCI